MLILLAGLATPAASSAALPFELAQRVNETSDGRGLRPASSDAQGSGTADDLGAAESLLVELVINQRAFPGAVRAERLADGRLALPLEVWNDARLMPAGPLLQLPDQLSGYALEAASGVVYELDRGGLTLSITAPASAFRKTQMTLSHKDEGALTKAPLGFYLDYDVSVTQVEDAPSYGALLRGVAFSGSGSIVSGLVLQADRDEMRAARTETYWRRDLPGRMERIVVGDAVSSAGIWSRPVRYAGIRYGRDFDLAPGYITYPMPSLSGSAALPSAVDVLVNNHGRRSGLKIEPGPFELRDVPVVGGAGQINLVVRDLRGVETLITESYYVSPRLLTPGLSDFSLEAGALRLNYGLEAADYGEGFAAATYRHGLTSAFTAGGRVEGQQGRQAAGVEFTALVGELGVLSAGTAWSRGEDEDASGDAVGGGRYLLGFERTTTRGGASVRWEYSEADFRAFGALPDEDRPRTQLQLHAGHSLGRTTSAGLSYVWRSTWEGERFGLVGATLGTELPWNLSLRAYANTHVSGGSGWSGGLTLVAPLGPRRSASASVDRRRDGTIARALRASQAPPAGPGWGWRVRASDHGGQNLQAGATLNTRFGELTADANFAAHANGARLGARGALGWVGGLPFASRSIGDGAFAVARAGGIKGLPIYRENQLVAVTNGRGLALVTGLLPYETNRMSIDATQLPFNVDIGGLEKAVKPYARTGVLVDFAVRRSRNALLVLRLPDSSPVPIGARAATGGTMDSAMVGRRGEVYLTDLQDQNRLTVTWKGGTCELAFELQAGLPDEPLIGPLICEPKP